MVPGCKYEKNPIILVAFNSASGQTAINALPNLDRKPDGFVGLDPFSINDRSTKIDGSIPNLEWGFSKRIIIITQRLHNL